MSRLCKHNNSSQFHKILGINPIHKQWIPGSFLPPPIKSLGTRQEQFMNQIPLLLLSFCLSSRIACLCVLLCHLVICSVENYWWKPVAPEKTWRQHFPKSWITVSTFYLISGMCERSNICILYLQIAGIMSPQISSVKYLTLLIAHGV